jgi:hypothetical protein
MTRVSTALVSLAIMLCALPALAQTQPTPAQVERMLEPLRPTAEHQELAVLAGRWRQEVTYAMGGPPMKATGIVTNRMILGGRFLVSEGTSNNPSGIGDPTVEFMSVYGFDRRTRDFTIVAFDTMGTYYVTAAGTKTSGGTVLMSGETPEYEAGRAATRKYDMVLKVIDADTYLSEIIFKFPGRPDQTIVSVTHTRMK